MSDLWMENICVRKVSPRLIKRQLRNIEKLICKPCNKRTKHEFISGSNGKRKYRCMTCKAEKTLKELS